MSLHCRTDNLLTTKGLHMPVLWGWGTIVTENKQHKAGKHDLLVKSRTPDLLLRSWNIKQTGCIKWVSICGIFCCRFCNCILIRRCVKCLRFGYHSTSHKNNPNALEAYSPQYLEYHSTQNTSDTKGRFRKLIWKLCTGAAKSNTP